MRKWSRILVALAVLLSVAGCEEDNTAELQEAGVVRCVINKVYTAPSGNTLQRLTPCTSGNTVALPVGGKVTTDTVGMGEADIDGCRIYIFDDGEIQRSPCTESQEESGTCLKKNTTVWKDNCKNKVITTETADLKLVGTWVWVTYLPDLRLTLVATLDGEVTATPRNDDGDPGEESAVPAGQFWYTAAGGVGDIAGVAARQAQPLELIAPVVEELRLTPWALSVERQARLDGIDLPAPLLPAGSVNVTADGGLLAEPEGATALLGGVSWREVVGIAAVEGPVSAFSAGFQPGISVLDIPFDFNRAAALVDEVGGVELTILVDEGSPSAVAVGEGAVGWFEEFGVAVNFAITDLEDAREQLSVRAEQEQPALLVTGN